MTDRNKWVATTEENPGHSAWHIERFREMAAAGDDLAGEARLVDAMAPRAARILDAGCGPGRVGAFLHALGHDVVGVDIDPELIAAAETDHPGPVWLVGDLAELDLASAGITDGFDVVVCAGNVIPFLADSTRVDVLAAMGAELRADGRVIIGFGAGRGYEFSEFLDDAVAAGLEPDLLLGSWDLRPFSEDSDFIVAVLRSGRS